MQASPSMIPADAVGTDDRVVDEHDQGEHEPRHHHRVDRLAACVEDGDRRRQREQDGEQGDHGGPELEEERAEREDQKDETDEQRGAQVVCRLLDVPWTEEEYESTWICR